MSAALRVFGIVLFGLSFLTCLALAPVTAGFTMILGVPALLLAVWLSRHDPADAPDISLGGAIALTVSVLAMFWVFLALLRGTDIFGRPL